MVDAEQEITDALVDAREERIERLARATKKARRIVARLVKF
jgi:hypothetical protein